MIAIDINKYVYQKNENYTSEGFDKIGVTGMDHWISLLFL